MTNDYRPGPVNVEGCVFDDFLLTEHLPPQKAPGVIERDRLIMSARPGFNRKLLPLCIAQDSCNIYSGGRYLFDTYENALAFGEWCRDEFEIDGVLILERPDFKDVMADTYRVVGAHDFKDLHSSQLAYRTEIWQSDAGDLEDRLANLWPALRDRAAEEDKAALWLLHQPVANEVALVTIIDRVGEVSAVELDYTTLDRVRLAPSYGDDWNFAEKRFDRSHWVYTIWFPNTGAANDKPALWPNSPPLPAPDDWMLKASAA